METIVEGKIVYAQRMFKSYYVVWKLYEKIFIFLFFESLNRTM